MEHAVHVRDLGVPTLTRPRGREAYHLLRERWRDGSLALLLDDVNMLSLSFLDGLVLELLAAGRIECVTFVTREPRTQEKLARVAGLHPEAALYFRPASSEERRRVTPAVVEPEEAPLELSKQEAQRPLEPTASVLSR